MEFNKERTEQAKRLELLTMHFNMTTRDLANLIGLNENTLYKINCGKCGMSERTAARICYHLERQKGVVVNRRWLLYGEGTMFDENLSSTQYTTEEEVHQPAIAAEEASEYGTNYREKYFALLEQYNELSRKYTAILERLQQ